MDRDTFHWDDEPGDAGQKPETGAAGGSAPWVDAAPGPPVVPPAAFRGDPGFGFGPRGASAPAPQQRRAARHQKQGRERDGGRAGRGWRFTWLYIPVVLVSAVLWVLLGPAAGTSHAGFICYNGIPVAMTEGVDVTQVREAQGSGGPRQGAQLDVAGDVRSLVGGGAALARLGDATVTSDHQLSDGAQVFEGRGQDVAEQLTKSSKNIPYETTMTGSGSIVVIDTKGQPGVGETYAGASSKRVVAEVVAKKPVNTVLRKTNTAKVKLAALTFDDGPDGMWTDAVLAALASRGVKATFFMLGQNAAALPGEVEKVRAAGHEVANHTWDHSNLTKLTQAQIQSEIQRADDVLGDTRYFRPPGGNYNKTVAAVAGSLGKSLILWSVDTRDWENHNADAIMANLKNELGPGAIILMHDGGGDRSATVAAIPRVIDYLLSQGYGITTLEQLTGG